ncbi:MAG: tetratricopeptide repeat protein [Candidatus Latescibacteria bacterium]|nr:tetratricopeptide repeat protein [Candidatus Latescibacterota bacterium]NIM21328.1 tetratricopeptide repeat protein [Candidatus Latescibacterota bacterium]NIM65509.1 tetratricopeptide repeat protein [Candidatus Latescibacterota bacterium]NIO01889.1 tetratricopeptide repeat protein [Candidatus Latescibacterota bacterium]NIO28702.1 tetratricopeptide repeat protein [Candidatus Latescibacterota bacterium]
MDALTYYIIVASAVVVLGALLLFLIGRRRKAPSEQDPYVEALKKLVDGDSSAAFKLLEQAVKRGAAPTHAYVKLGELLRERGEAGKALQIHQSLTVKTNLSKRETAELYLNMAEDYACLGRPGRAVSVLETASNNFNIKDPQIRAFLAKQLHILGERDRAFESLKELKRLGHIGDRELALYLTTASEHHTGDKDPKETKRLLHKALKYDPDCAPALLALGNLEESAGKSDEAIRLWKRVAAVSPDLAGSALKNLERILFQRGRFGEIEQIYQDVLAVRNEDEEATLSLADFYTKQGREEDALRLLEDFHVSHQESFGCSLLLAALYSKLREGGILETFLDESVSHFYQGKRYSCNFCGHETEMMRWHCPKCNSFDSFSASNAK